MLQGIRRPKKSERKRIRKVGDAGGDGGARNGARTAAEQIQEQLGFGKEDEGGGPPNPPSQRHRVLAARWCIASSYERFSMLLWLSLRSRRGCRRILT